MSYMGGPQGAGGVQVTTYGAGAPLPPAIAQQVQFANHALQILQFVNAHTIPPQPHGFPANALSGYNIQSTQPQSSWYVNQGGYQPPGYNVHVQPPSVKITYTNTQFRPHPQVPQYFSPRPEVPGYSRNYTQQAPVYVKPQTAYQPPQLQAAPVLPPKLDILVSEQEYPKATYSDQAKADSPIAPETEASSEKTIGKESQKTESTPGRRSKLTSKVKGWFRGGKSKSKGGSSVEKQKTFKAPKHKGLERASAQKSQTKTENVYEGLKGKTEQVSDGSKKGNIYEPTPASVKPQSHADEIRTDPNPAYGVIGKNTAEGKSKVKKGPPPVRPQPYSGKKEASSGSLPSPISAAESQVEQPKVSSLQPQKTAQEVKNPSTASDEKSLASHSASTAASAKQGNKIGGDGKTRRAAPPPPPPYTPKTVKSQVNAKGAPPAQVKADTGLKLSERPLPPTPEWAKGSGVEDSADNIYESLDLEESFDEVDLPLSQPSKQLSKAVATGLNRAQQFDVKFQVFEAALQKYTSKGVEVQANYTLKQNTKRERIKGTEKITAGFNEYLPMLIEVKKASDDMNKLIKQLSVLTSMIDAQIKKEGAVAMPDWYTKTGTKLQKAQALQAALKSHISDTAVARASYSVREEMDSSIIKPWLSSSKKLQENLKITQSY